MNPCVLQFANGNSLFIGLALSCVACLLLMTRMPRVGQSALTVTAIVGAIGVMLSATPFPVWAYALWGGSLAACLVTAGSSSVKVTKYKRLMILLLFLVSAGLAAAEWPYHRTKALPFPADKPICVLGDSISAGTDARVPSWPDVLSQMSKRRVTNLAFGGNKVSGALAEARSIRNVDCSVLLEIGGNDILDGTTSATFEQDLRALLSEVCKEGRIVAMLELPLPPFFNRFGAAQRRQARAFGVILIPKQCMTDVFGFPDATVDGLHLSATGHRRLAQLLNEMIENSRKTCDSPVRTPVTP